MATSAASIAAQLQRLSNEATFKSFEYNTREANTARTWQKMMSDTSHQREVQDLQKAGLNPVLASNQGAQSYTTSSASAQADSATNAVGNVWSSQIGADATRSAAAASAAATRYAAAQQASAARYAAAMQYQTQKDSWKWKTDFMQKEYKAKENLVLKTPVNNLGGVIDKFATKAGLYDLAGSKGVKSVRNNAMKLMNNPMSFFKDLGQGVKVAANNFKLNSSGNNVVGNALSGMKVSNTAANRNLFVRAFVFGNASAQAQLQAQLPKKGKRSSVNSAFPKSYVGVRLDRIR